MDRRRWLLLTGAVAVAVVTAVVLVTVQVPVGAINLRTKAPAFLVAFAQEQQNSTAVVDLTLDNFTLDFEGGFLSGKHASLHADVSNLTDVSARIDLTVALQEFEFETPDVSGSLGSATLTGFVVVDSRTNELIVSLTTSTTLLDLLRSLIGF